MDSIVRKVVKEGHELEYFILSAEWCENSISVTVIDNEIAWSGKLEQDDIDSLSKSINREKRKYFSEVIGALIDSDGFIFTIENERFIMKKIDSRTNIKIRFCTIPLSKIPVLPSLSSVVGKLLDNEEVHKSSISIMTDELKYLKREREDLVKKLEIFIEEKSSLETMLYSQFCDVLNCKKQKIRVLEAQLSSANSSENIPGLNQNLVIKQEHEEEEDRGGEGGEGRQLECTRMFTSRSLGDDQTESNENSTNSDIQSERKATEVNKHSSHYDSETDIDTDNEGGDDCKISHLHEKINVPTVDTSIRKKRILPKRGSSSSVQNEKRPCPVVVPTTYVEKQDEELEFNSQSLLDEY